jgi:hypothetical protein
VVRRSRLKTVIFLVYEPTAASVQKLSAEEALNYVTEGAYQVPREGGLGEMKNQPFFNPYLLDTSVDQQDVQRRNFHQLFRVARAFKVNTAVIPPEALRARIRDLIG